jgi:SAM-dependent methyltransferase
VNGPVGCIYEPLWKMVSAQLPPVLSGKAIDFGCGDGKYSFLLKNLGFDALGVDFSAQAIQVAEKIRDEKRIEGVDFVVDSTIPGTVAEASVDVVMMLNSYHCLNSSARRSVLKSAARVLNLKGVLILSVLSTTDESYPRDKWARVGDNSYKDENGRFFHFFSKDELMEELQSFKVTGIQILENIHPDVGRRSSLYVVTARIKD